MTSSNQRNPRAATNGAEIDHLAGYSRASKRGRGKRIKRAINKRARQFKQEH
jgi:hypothetical protein